jgi:hypothetical protein
VSSAKTAGIILGILVPLILIVFFIIFYCRRIAQDGDDPELYYTEKSLRQQQGKQSPVQPSKSIPLTVMDVPVDRSPPREQMNIVRSVPIERIESLENSPRSSRSSTSSKRDSDLVNRKTPSQQATAENQSSAPKQPSNYDGVYYTGEPLPGREKVDFSSSEDDEEPGASNRNGRAFVSPKVSV